MEAEGSGQQPKGRQFTIQRAIRLLPQSKVAIDGLSTFSEEERQSFQVLVHNCVTMMEQWYHRWAPDPDMRSFLNKRTILTEIEECLMPLWFLLHGVLGTEDEEKLVIFDLCSGKGILSACIASLTPWYPALSRVRKIVLVDNLKVGGAKSGKAGGGQVNLQHVEVFTRTKGLIPLEFFKVDLHSDAFQALVRHEQKAQPVLLLGIHLCRNLSVRAIQMFNDHLRVPILMLAPCCVPGKGQREVCLPLPDGTARTISVEAVHKSQCPYEQWTAGLQSLVIPDAEVQCHIVPLSGGPHRCNRFLIVRRRPRT